MKHCPPHTTVTGEVVEFHMDAGGHVVQEPGTAILCCTRCEVVSGEIESVAALGAFMWAHAGAVCGVAVVKKTKTRRAA